MGEIQRNFMVAAKKAKLSKKKCERLDSHRTHNMQITIAIPSQRFNIFMQFARRNFFYKWRVVRNSQDGP